MLQFLLVKGAGQRAALENLRLRGIGLSGKIAAERLRNLLAEFGLQSLEATRYAGLDAVLAPRSSAAASADE